MSQHDHVDIGGTIDRLEEIAETLEDGEVGLQRAKELREEADEKLATLRDALDVGDGDIIEIDSDELDGETASSSSE
jgi:Exonuclease VII small subunit.